MKKFSTLAILTAMSVFLLAGCGNNEGDMENSTEGSGGQNAAVTNVSLKVWVPQNQVDSGIIQQQQEAFSRLHPEWNISWTTEVVGEDVAKEHILRDVDAAADVFLFASDQLVELVNAGAVARLGGETEDLVKETLPEAVKVTAMVEDGVYGIPFTHNTFHMYYDKTLMTEEDVKTMEGIVGKETADDVYNFYFESSSGWKLGAWYYGAGLNIFGPDGTDIEAGVDWNNETGVAVTEYLIDLINNPKVAYDNEISVSELIAEHRLGGWFDGSWNHQTYVDALGEDLGFGVIPTYHLKGTDIQLLGFYSSKCIGVNALSKNPAAAVAFAAYLGNEENQLLRYEQSGQIPTNINAANSEAVLADPLANVIAEEVSKASVIQPVSAEFSARYWIYANAIPTEIRSGELTKDNVQEKLDTFAAAMTK